jgi:hypothetical protein
LRDEIPGQAPGIFLLAPAFVAFTIQIPEGHDSRYRAGFHANPLANLAYANRKHRAKTRLAAGRWG